MPFFDPIRIGASGAVATSYSVDRSLRFNTTDQTVLTKSLSTSPTNRKKTTLSFWFKKSKLSYGQGVITSGASGTGGSTNGTRIYLNSDDTFKVNTQISNSTVWNIDTNRKFRDPSAWMHFCMSLDTTQSTASDRVKIYFNGVQETSFSSASYPSQDYDDIWAYGNYRIGDYGGDYGYYFGYQSYIAEVITIDGQALDPSSFTETDATTGQLVPKDPSGLTFGTNGFHLKFADNSGTSATTLGKDSSGNGNNFTPNNFSVAAGTGNDSMKDTPTNNFATFNSAFETASSASYGNGNLEFSTSSTGQKLARSTFAHNSGKWYAEFKLVSYSSASGSYPYIGVAPSNKADPYGDHNTWVGYIGTAVNTAGSAFKDGSVISGGFTYAAGDIIGMAMDVDNLLVYFYKNGTIQNSGSGYALTSDSDKGYQFAVSLYASSGTWAANLGGIGIGSNSDANGHGNFTYSVPSGYLAECSANLSDPTILLPNKHFAAFTYTGTGSSGDVVNITNSDVDFTPDWVWVKTRSVSNDHILSDSVRGGTKYLVSSENYAEQTDTDKIRAFIQNGFESGTDGDTNWPSRTFVAWNWNAGDTDGKTYAVTVVSDSGNKYRFDGFGTSAVTLDLAEGGTYVFDWSDSSAQSHPVRFSTTSDGTHGGGTEYTTGVTKDDSAYKTTITVAASAPTLYYYCQNHSGMGGQVNTNSTLGSSNFDGNNQSTVKVNATAGFSIVSYTGTGANNTNVTMGHGLGVAPDAVILKNRDISPYGAKEWVVWHQDVGTDSTYVYKNLRLDSTGAASANSDQFRTVDASTIQVRSPDSSNGKVNANNNKYIAYVFSEVAGYSKFGSYIGNGSSDGTFIFLGFKPAWVMIKRSSATEGWQIFDNKRDPDNVIENRIEANTAEGDVTSIDWLDFLSNGIKHRVNRTNTNTNASTYIYLAFAESPFKNARAR